MASLILALLKALPTTWKIIHEVRSGFREYERQQNHKQVDKDREEILSTGWRCPARCPYRGMHEQPESEQIPAVEGTS
jgi:hypothetical protein